MDRCHYGDEFVHALYCCGVYDAVYLDEVSADGIMGLIKDGRNCAQAREYYGICTLRDAERQRNLVNEECLNAYLECIEEGQGTEEINERYRFAVTRLGAEENRILAGSITASVVNELVGNELYQFYKGGAKEKRRWFPKRKSPVVQNTAVSSFDDFDVMTDFEQETEEILDTGNPAAEVSETVEKSEPDVEDMFAVMERFRMMAAADAENSVTDINETNLMIVMGNYLRTVDV